MNLFLDAGRSAEVLRRDGAAYMFDLGAQSNNAEIYVPEIA